MKYFIIIVMGGDGGKDVSWFIVLRDFEMFLEGFVFGIKNYNKLL